MLVDSYKKGITFEEMNTPEDIRKKVLKVVASDKKEEAKPAMKKFVGRVVKETEKAVLFASQNGEIWFPKSQTNITERAQGDYDEILIPEWLYSEKF